MKNATLIKACKQILKDLVYQCSPPQQLMFKRMYCHKNLDATVEEAVEQMDPDKIDWAVTQTEKTIKDNNDKLEENTSEL